MSEFFSSWQVLVRSFPRILYIFNVQFHFMWQKIRKWKSLEKLEVKMQRWAIHLFSLLKCFFLRYSLLWTWDICLLQWSWWNLEILQCVEGRGMISPQLCTVVVWERFWYSSGVPYCFLLVLICFNHMYISRNIWVITDYFWFLRVAFFCIYQLRSKTYSEKKRR